MKFDTIRFLRDHRIDYRDDRKGWVHVNCPFGCGYPDYHLGINLREGYGNCWRCGGHSIMSIIQAFLHCTWSEAGIIFRKYSGNVPYQTYRKEEPHEVMRATSRQCKLPYGTGIMSEIHRSYLQRREFDDILLEKTYDLLGTKHLGNLAFRIVAPIYWNGKIVSYQCRDVTDKAKLRYVTCDKENEIIHHKHILYAADLTDGKSCVAVEGITDVWRLGPGAVGTFGTSFTTQQVVELSKFKRVFLLFDPELSAKMKAREVVSKLSIICQEVYLVEHDFKCDPGDLKQDDANALMREMGLKGWN